MFYLHAARQVGSQLSSPHTMRMTLPLPAPHVSRHSSSGRPRQRAMQICCSCEGASDCCMQRFNKFSNQLMGHEDDSDILQACQRCSSSALELKAATERLFQPADLCAQPLCSRMSISLHASATRHAYVVAVQAPLAPLMFSMDCKVVAWTKSLNNWLRKLALAYKIAGTCGINVESKLA